MDVNLKFNQPGIGFTLDRIKMRDLGLSTSDVIAAMQCAFSGGRLAYFIHEWISVSGNGAGRQERQVISPQILQTYMCAISMANNIPLSAVLKMQRE